MPETATAAAAPTPATHAPTAPAPGAPRAGAAPPDPRPRPVTAEHGGDRLALAVAGATLGLRGADRGALARRMRLTASAVLLFVTGAHRPAPDGGRLRRTAALNALKRLAGQVALAERLGYLDPPTALALLEEQIAVRLTLTGPAAKA